MGSQRATLLFGSRTMGLVGGITYLSVLWVKFESVVAILNGFVEMLEHDECLGTCRGWVVRDLRFEK